MYPSVGFKLDAASDWTPEIIEALAGTGAVRTVDFKGRYGIEVEDEAALGALYDACSRRSRRRSDRGPARASREMPRPAAGERVSFDAPITRVEDIGSTRT